MEESPWIDVIPGLGSLISGVAALAATWISYRTLREMARQRQEELLPYLASESALQHFYLHWTKSDSEFPLPVWSITRDFDASRVYDFGIRIRNIGRGPARRITAIWQYDAVPALRAMDELDPSHRIEVGTLMSEHVDFPPGFPSVRMEGGTPIALGDLLPCAAIPDSTFLSLPPEFLPFVAVLYCMRWSRKPADVSIPQNESLTVV